MAENDNGPDLITLTVEVVSAYVANNPLQGEKLADLIGATHAALSGLAGRRAPEAPAEEEFKPAVSVRKSLASPAHILSMIDGKPYKTLKRHLTRHGLTPAEYRARYRLPSDYPMVAPAYSEVRRATAVKLGLGKMGRAAKAKAAGGRPPAKPAGRKRATRA